MRDDLVEDGKGKIDDEAYDVHDDLAENGRSKTRPMLKLTMCIILLRTVKVR